MTEKTVYLSNLLYFSNLESSKSQKKGFYAVKFLKTRFWDFSLF